MVLYLRQFEEALGRETAESLFARRGDTIVPFFLLFAWTVPEILDTERTCSACPCMCFLIF